MYLHTLLLSVLSASVLAGPTNLMPRAAGDRGSYTVSGLGLRKQAVLNAGGNTLDIAIAMLETENMQATYAYGQSYLLNHHELS